MTTKYFLFFLLAILGMVSYNVFLIERDRKMFDTYYGGSTAAKRACAEMKSFHPDCPNR